MAHTMVLLSISSMAPLFTFFLLFFFFHAQAQPVHTNGVEFGDYVTENGATYRSILIATPRFQLCFYNITPDASYLALRIDTSRTESNRRWVWQASPFGPIGENATFSLGGDGNLVLAVSDGQTVWSTSTANKGVVGLKVPPNGNVVLSDARDRFVRQSFDHAVDTALVGQPLLHCSGGPNKLVNELI